MITFEDSVMQALAGLPTDKTADNFTADTQFASLELANMDMLGLLDSIKQWLIHDAAKPMPVSRVEALATSKRHHRKLFLHYIDTRWRIGYASRVDGSGKLYSLRTVEGQKLLQYFNIEQLAQGVAELVQREHYSVPHL